MDNLAEITRLTRALANGPQRRMDADRAAGRGLSRADLDQAHHLHLQLARLQEDATYLPSEDVNA